ncbi:MAG TPA: SGNH/GDSL hydrolase family protein [Candidatus Atribacteria bacterium]|nr:SGNH/GDSL hydrolase family protein [Candidatus Atribacteria bacterium]
MICYTPYRSSYTAYNLKKDKSTTNSNKKLFTIIDKIKRKKDIVMLVFGEIDCRIHIYYQYKKNNEKFTITELIDRTISNYGEVLEQLDIMDITFCVYGIPPAAKVGNVYDYPFYASPEMRSKINKEFNKRLKKFCKEKGYKYMDIYSKVVDKNGFILEEYAADTVHLNNKVQKFVKEWLNNEFGINM